MLEKIVRNFNGHDIRFIKRNGTCLISPHDIAEVIGHGNPREAVVKQLLRDNTKYQFELHEWKVNESIFVVELRFVIDMILEGMLDGNKASDLIMWLIKFITNETQRTSSYNVNQPPEQIRYPKYEKYTMHDQSKRGLFATTQIAKRYEISAIELNRLLKNARVQHRVNGQWVLNARYADKGFTKSLVFKKENGEFVEHTYWTKKGEEFITEFLDSALKHQLRLFDC